ncbi:hypothetical protein OAK15_05465 [Verrucomicrobia bacterium]|nr:hypothetical protein [Verrucomicrobiota bacterium]
MVKRYLAGFEINILAKRSAALIYGTQMNADLSDPMDFHPVHPLDLRSSASQP